jgi:glycosyltransferase involved in cell wall biosynthesis
MPGSSRLVSAARRRLARISVHVPADRGPSVVRGVVERARVFEADRLLRTGEPEAAIRVVEPLLRSNSTGRSWHMIARIREQQGDRVGALNASRQASAADRADVAVLVTHWRLAGASGEEDEARKILGRVLTTPPRDGVELDAALEILPWASASEVAKYETALESWRVPFDRERLRDAEAESRLVDMHAENPDAYRLAVQDVENQRPNALGIVVRALTRRRAWDDLADYVRYWGLGDGRSAPSARAEVAEFPVVDLRRAASRALSAGRTTAARTLAGRVLAEQPRDRARETFDDAADQLAVVTNGWSFGAPRRTPYEPRPRATLSVLAQSLPIRSGGYATRSHGVLTGLAARGWDVAAVTRLGFPYDRWGLSTTREVPPSDVVDGITYHRLLEADARQYPQSPLSSYIGRFSDGIVDHAYARRAALIHASSFHVNGLAAGAAATRLGLPFLYEMRGLEDLMRVSRDPSFVSCDRHAFLTMLELAICHRADAVFVITEALRREMAGRGVPEQKMVVLPNGVHVEQFSPRERDREVEARLRVAGKMVIGYAGGLVDYEGLDLLLDAVADLKSRRSDFHVVIVGDGYYERVLRAYAHRLRLDDVVTFTGRVSHDEIGRYLSLFDVVPFPRLPRPVCELISPIKPFESMAMQKPIVVSSVAALTEIVRDGVTGLVFRKGDSADLARTMERLLDSPELRSSLGRAARDWVVAERDWSRIVETVDTTYRAVLRHTALPSG